MVEKPKPRSSLGEQELDRAEKQFKEFEQNIQDLTLDTMNEAPKMDQEASHKISQKEISESKDVYLKPHRSIPSRERFNEDYRDKYNFAKEYVYFIAENKEVIGEDIDLWVKPFAGMPAEWWKVPVGKPIWAPRYVAERIKGCSYHQLTMENQVTDASRDTQFYGHMVAKKTVQRLDAIPTTKQKSLFMGAAAF